MRRREKSRRRNSCARSAPQGELARDLAYRLFDLSERKNRSQEAQAYNALVLGWPEIARLARAKTEEQGALFEG
jgi:putative DNA methylase